MSTDDSMSQQQLQTLRASDCSRRPIGSIDEGIAVRIQERRFFNSLQWVRLERPPAPVRQARSSRVASARPVERPNVRDRCAQHHEAWVLIKNGAGTRFLRPASTTELHKMTDDSQPDFEVDPITMEPCGKHT